MIKPIRMVFSSGAFKAFSYWVNMFGTDLQKSGDKYTYPIIVDRLYRLTNIEHAYEYCIDYDIEDGHQILGEHIGLNINKLDEEGQIGQHNPELEKIQVWKPIQLLDVDRYIDKDKAPLPKTLGAEDQD